MNPYHSAYQRQEYHRYYYYTHRSSKKYTEDELTKLCENPNNNTKYYPPNSRPKKYKQNKGISPSYPTPDKEGQLKENDQYIFYRDKVWSKLRDKYLKVHCPKKQGKYCHLNIFDKEKNTYIGEKYFIFAN